MSGRCRGARTVMLLLAAWMLAASRARAFSLDLGYQFGNEQQRQSLRFVQPLTGYGARLWLPLNPRWRGAVGYDYLVGQNQHWDPAGVLEVFRGSQRHPLGSIRSRREEYLSTLWLRYVLFESNWPQKYWTLHGFLEGAAGWSHTRIDLRDSYYAVHDVYDDFTWQFGVGGEWLFLQPKDEAHRKNLGVYAALDWREHRLELNRLGNGYNSHPSRFFGARLGLELYLGE